MINNSVLAMIVHNVQDEYMLGIADREDQAMRMLDSHRKDALGLLLELVEAREAVQLASVHVLDDIHQASDRLRQVAILLLEALVASEPLLEPFCFERYVHNIW